MELYGKLWIFLWIMELYGGFIDLLQEYRCFKAPIEYKKLLTTFERT